MFEYDQKETLRRTIAFLKENGLVPRGCPKRNCLYVDRIIVDGNSQVSIEIGAQPPAPPRDMGGRTLSLHPFCQDNCTFHGDDERYVEVVQALTPSRRIQKVRSDWR
ncbi:hypothetical protein KBC75_00720 [Candidatus Shapirobacteria bacterium]|nr:hypothetical protein [Candidatus Shapirobacteria bacterium]